MMKLKKKFSVLLSICLVLTMTLGAKALELNPKQIEVNLSGIPSGLISLAIEYSIDTSIVEVESASTNIPGVLAVAGESGIGLLSTLSELPTNITITLNLKEVAAGTSSFQIGNVLDKIGGSLIPGASASAGTSSIEVIDDTVPPASDGLDSDSFEIKLENPLLSTASALNIILSFTNPGVASLDPSSPEIETPGLTKLLTSTDINTNTLSIIWSGSSNEITISGMLLPGQTLGSSDISVVLVELVGGVDITNGTTITVTPSTVTNSEGEVVLGNSQFTLIGPNHAISPGRVAIAINAENISDGVSATINNFPVNFTDSTTGVAIIDLPEGSGNIDLVLKEDSGEEHNLGVLSVTPGNMIGLPPIIFRAYTVPALKGNKLKLRGRKFGVRRFGRENIDVEIIPNTREKNFKRLSRKKVDTNGANNCIERDSYVNISHAAGTYAKKIVVREGCN